MNSYRSIAGFVFAMALGLFACLSFAADSSIPASIPGHWEGDARIIVDWCHQKSIHVTVTIAADGSVTGKVGDAALVNARLERNRGWLGRKLALATDYIIKGELSGPVIVVEGITRNSVSIPLDSTGSTLVGGLHTSGAKLGGKSAGILSASSLVLRH